MSNAKPSKTKRQNSDRPVIMGRGPGHGPGRGLGGSSEKASDTRGTLMRLVAYLKNQIWLLVVVLTLTVIRTALDSVGPYLNGVAIDALLMSDWTLFTNACLGRLGVGSFSAISNWVSSYISATLAQRTVQDIRNDLIAKIETLSLRFFDQHAHGDLMSRLTNDVETVSNILTSSATQLVGSLISMITVFAMMLVTNVPMTFVTILSLPLLLMISRPIRKYTRKRYRLQQETLGELNGIIEETVSGQKVVKAFAHEDESRAAFYKSNRALQKVATEAGVVAGAMGPLGGLTNNITLAIVAVFGGWFALQGKASVGTIASFMSYSRMFARPINQIAQLLNVIQSALAGAERVFDTLDQEPELTDKPKALPMDDVKGKVVFDEVCFGYEEGVPVLKNVSMYNNPGETIALVGPTGAGKTTIINLLTRFYDIDSGSIKIDDIDLRDYKKDDLRHKLGLVLQDNFLFADTVMENIRYGRLDATDEEVIAAATLAEADAFIHRLPDGYQTELSERGSNLSLGQRQLLAIARTILADPEILILDEATSNVDTRTEKHLQAALLKLMDGRTSFVIAHRLSTIRDADCVMVIRDGEIIERGTHDHLLEKEGFYYNLYMSQFKGKNPMARAGD